MGYKKETLHIKLARELIIKAIYNNEKCEVIGSFFDFEQVGIPGANGIISYEDIPISMCIIVLKNGEIKEVREEDLIITDVMLDKHIPKDFLEKISKGADIDE